MEELKAYCAEMYVMLKALNKHHIYGVINTEKANCSLYRNTAAATRFYVKTLAKKQINQAPLMQLMQLSEDQVYMSLNIWPEQAGNAHSELSRGHHDSVIARVLF